MIPNISFHLFAKSQYKTAGYKLIPRLIFNIRCFQQFNAMSTKVPPTQMTKESFEAVLPSILNTLAMHNDLVKVPDVSNRLKMVLESILTGGKRARGLTTVFAYEMLEKPENITEETLHSAKILGWCVEMLHAVFVVCDDMIDGSISRHGKPCWYRLPTVGLDAINDTSLVFAAISYIIKTQFEKEKSYIDFLEQFYKATLLTSAGEHLDIAISRRKQGDCSLFTMERYHATAKYKTSSYSYTLPVCLGMLLANISDPVLHRKAEDICTKIGIFYQMQDDYIDCYEDESVSGKAGTDIRGGKCTWLAVTALQLCSPSQRNVFATYYGSQESAHIDRIKELYDQLELPKLYSQEETTMYESLMKQVHQLPKELPPALFVRLIDMIYKRRY